MANKDPKNNFFNLRYVFAKRIYGDMSDADTSDLDVRNIKLPDNLAYTEYTLPCSTNETAILFTDEFITAIPAIIQSSITIRAYTLTGDIIKAYSLQEFTQLLSSGVYKLPYPVSKFEIVYKNTTVLTTVDKKETISLTAPEFMYMGDSFKVLYDYSALPFDVPVTVNLFTGDTLSKSFNVVSNTLYPATSYSSIELVVADKCINSSPCAFTDISYNSTETGIMFINTSSVTVHYEVIFNIVDKLNGKQTYDNTVSGAISTGDNIVDASVAIKDEVASDTLDYYRTNYRWYDVTITSIKLIYTASTSEECFKNITPPTTVYSIEYGIEAIKQLKLNDQFECVDENIPAGILVNDRSRLIHSYSITEKDNVEVDYANNKLNIDYHTSMFNRYFKGYTSNYNFPSSVSTSTFNKEPVVPYVSQLTGTVPKVAALLPFYYSETYYLFCEEYITTDRVTKECSATIPIDFDALAAIPYDTLPHAVKWYNYDYVGTYYNGSMFIDTQDEYDIKLYYGVNGSRILSSDKSTSEYTLIARKYNPDNVILTNMMYVISEYDMMYYVPSHDNNIDITLIDNILKGIGLTNVTYLLGICTVAGADNHIYHHNTAVQLNGGLAITSSRCIIETGVF